MDEIIPGDLVGRREVPDPKCLGNHLLCERHRVSVWAWRVDQEPSLHPADDVSFTELVSYVTGQDGLKVASVRALEGDL